MSRGVACLSAVAFLAVLAFMAVSATACEGGGGGGAELTTLSTKLSGESKEGEELTVLEGAKVKDKATLSGKNASKATGKVTYKMYSDKECKTLFTTAGEVTVSGGSIPASSEETPEPGKTYYWQAHYGGDTNNAESTSPCTEILNVKAKTSLSTELSTEGEEGEELTVLEGSKVKDKAVLTGTNSSTAGGKAAYKVYSDKECKTFVTGAGEVTVSSGSIPASSEEELEVGETYYWQVTYEGDGLHEGSISGCNEVVNVDGCVFPYCERPIVPGVRIGLPAGNCTAGPILKQGGDAFLLTAGHCVQGTVSTGTEAVEQEVKSSRPLELAPKLIGKKIMFNYTTEHDIAEVKIEEMGWLVGGVAASPFAVEWGEGGPKVMPVVARAANSEGEETCLSGAVSGLQCGVVLRTGATYPGTPEMTNLVETTIKSAQGDSGAPEFVRGLGGLLIQGVAVAGGGKTFTGTGLLMNLGFRVENLPEGKLTCERVLAMKTMWLLAGVPITGLGIPANTTIEQCTEETGNRANLLMSAQATVSGLRAVIFGRSVLQWYEPLSRIEAVYPGQELVVH